MTRRVGRAGQQSGRARQQWGAVLLTVAFVALLIGGISCGSYNLVSPPGDAALRHSALSGVDLQFGLVQQPHASLLLAAQMTVDGAPIRLADLYALNCGGMTLQFGQYIVNQYTAALPISALGPMTCFLWMQVDQPPTVFQLATPPLPHLRTPPGASTIPHGPPLAITYDPCSWCTMQVGLSDGGQARTFFTPIAAETGTVTGLATDQLHAGAGTITLVRTWSKILSIPDFHSVIERGTLITDVPITWT